MPSLASRPGVRTSEFWISLALALVGPLVTLLVGFGVFREDQATEVQSNLTAAVEAVAVIVSNVVSILAAKGYVSARTGLKLEEQTKQ